MVGVHDVAGETKILIRNAEPPVVCVVHHACEAGTTVPTVKGQLFTLLFRFARLSLLLFPLVPFAIPDKGLVRHVEELGKRIVLVFRHLLPFGRIKVVGFGLIGEQLGGEGLFLLLRLLVLLVGGVGLEGAAPIWSGNL